MDWIEEALEGSLRAGRDKLFEHSGGHPQGE